MLTIGTVIKKDLDLRSSKFNQNFRRYFCVAQLKEPISRFFGFNILLFSKGLDQKYSDDLLKCKIEKEATMKEKIERIKLLFNEVMTDYVTVKSEIEPIAKKYVEYVTGQKFWSWEMLYWHFTKIEKLAEYQDLPQKKLFTLIFLFGLNKESFIEFFTKNFKTNKTELVKKVKDLFEDSEVKKLTEDTLQLSYSMDTLDSYRHWQEILTQDILSRESIHRDILNKARKAEFIELEKRPYVFNSMGLRQIEEHSAKKNLRMSIKNLKGGALY